MSECPSMKDGDSVTSSSSVESPTPGEALGELWQAGYSLTQRDYTNTASYQQDLRLLSEGLWLLVDHESRISKPGDYFLFEIGHESIVIVRDRDSKVRAHFNVCRHRGSRICLKEAGSVRTLACPYHGWTYDLAGKLIAVPLAEATMDKSNLGLWPCHVEVFEGLIFVNLSRGKPPAFKPFVERFSSHLKPYDLRGAKVAARRTFSTNANWKLTVENFHECYHCKRAHPTYCSVHDELKMLALGAGPGSGDRHMEKYGSTYDSWCTAERLKGRPVTQFSDDATAPFLQSSARIPIGRGAVTESIDGKAVGPLMVSWNEYDGSQTGSVFNPVGVVLACADHAVLFRMTPRGPLKTDTEAIWLVKADAVEGRDYEVERLVGVWAPTLAEDKTITENNQAGVLSSRYTPGPYQSQEQRISEFGKWYHRRIQALQSHASSRDER